MKHPHLMNTLAFRDEKFIAGQDEYLITADGRKYLDMYSDTGTASLGYNSSYHRAVLERILRDGIPHHCPSVFQFEERDRAAERICAATGMERVFFSTSGAESVEAAIKIARKTQHDRGEYQRTDIYAVLEAFHGRTYGALAASDGPMYHYAGFAPFLPGFRRFDSTADIRPDATAVILAPVWGNYGLQVYGAEWLQDLSRYCHCNGILVIYDEVMTGAGRCGGDITLNQLYDTDADIICMAKGVAMGCPVGVTLARGDAAEALTPGSHFSTFGGNPLSVAHVNGMLDYLEAPQTISDIRHKGARLRGLLRERKWAHNVRGEGLLNGFDIGLEKMKFAEVCAKHGVLLGLFRPGPGPVKLTPPLTVNFEQITFAIDAMDAAYNEMTLS